MCPRPSRSGRWRLVRDHLGRFPQRQDRRRGGMSLAKKKRELTPAAVVTGAGQGIGRGIVLALAREGFDVAGIDNLFEPRNRKKGLIEVKEKVEELGRRFLPIAGDVARLEDHVRMLDEAVEEFGRIDVLVNNAGVAPAKRADILETAPESSDRLPSLNP